MVNGTQKKFRNSRDLNRMIPNIKRAIQPFEELPSLRMVDDFLHLSVKDQSGRLLVRAKAMAFISDQDDFE